MCESLKNKVALVTASTRGIGLAIVKNLAQKGATVYMAARRLEYADELASSMNQEFGWNVKTVCFDAYDETCYSEMMKTISEQEGRLDILVNNFGTSNPMKDRSIEDTEWKEFRETVDVDLESVFRTTQEALPLLKIRGGSIINISSIGGNVPDISQIAYGTSKAAINYLTKLFAVQLGRYQIRSNAVLPGMTATDAVKDNLSDHFRDMVLHQTPLNRMATPEEIAAAVAYFASDEAAFTTGQILEVAGGFGLGTPVYGDLMNGSNRR
ncbi:7alpha-hydroxysteroid dehydrogenase [Ileibacterium valens]|uniref:7alpha-hydroxysteroid dehydrogenase n=1 Tax=Ileibacterium valens TaxID=1862668 RepID=UPI00235400BC|nr:SDR family oxidoreductase [Ileibacterium valens]